MALRTVAVVLVLVPAAGLLAADKKPARKAAPRFTAATVKKIDAGKGLLTVTVATDGQPKDVDLKVGEQTRFIAFGASGDPTELAGKDGLKAAALKPGTAVRYVTDAAGNATLVTTGPFFGRPDQPRPRAGAFVGGRVKTVDPGQGLLIVIVRGKGGPREVELKITDDTRFLAVTPVGAEREYAGKDGLKVTAFQEGAAVRYFADADGTVRVVLALPVFEKPKTLGPGRVTTGKVKTIDAARGLLTVSVTQKGTDKDVQFKLAADTRFVIPGGGGKAKRLTAREAERSEQFKQGAEVRVSADQGGRARVVMPIKK